MFLRSLRHLLQLALLLYAFPLPSVIPTLNEKLNVDLVDLYLTATNNKGGFVTDLKASELTVKENGVIQRISAFTNFANDIREAPLTLVMLIDTSGSMSDDIGNVWKIDIAKQAAVVLLDELNPKDESLLVTFDETSHFSDLTVDREKIRSSLGKIKVEFGGTALFDALLDVMNRISGKYGRKIVLVCSDGNDTISKVKLDQVLEKLSEQPDIAVVALGTVSYKSSREYTELMKDYVEGRIVLNKLADISGGYAFFPTTLKEADKVRELMRQFLLSQYSLAYLPINRTMDGAWRKIGITCSRKGVRLRYRNGYFAR